MEDGICGAGEKRRLRSGERLRRLVREAWVAIMSAPIALLICHIYSGDCLCTTNGEFAFVLSVLATGLCLPISAIIALIFNSLHEYLYFLVYLFDVNEHHAFLFLFTVTCFAGAYLQWFVFMPRLKPWWSRINQKNIFRGNVLLLRLPKAQGMEAETFSASMWVRLTRELWVAAAAGLLWCWWLDSDFLLHKGCAERRDEPCLSFLMILSSPTGWVMAKLFNLLLLVNLGAEIVFIVKWIGLLLIGYWQWFVFVPKIIDSRRQRQDAEKTKEEKD